MTKASAPAEPRGDAHRRHAAPAGHDRRGAPRRARLQRLGRPVDRGGRGPVPAGPRPRRLRAGPRVLHAAPIAEAIADLVCPLLAELAGYDGVVRAFEPSVGIGRLIRALGPPRCLVTDPRYKETRWTAVELSEVSAKMFAAMRPDVELYTMSLEQWMSEHAARYQGTLGLIVANPPYGERGEYARQDKHPDYQERAYAYFMRRCLDLLCPRGLGVFVIPAGFLTGSHQPQAARAPAAAPSPRGRVPPPERDDHRQGPVPRRRQRRRRARVARPRRRARAVDPGDEFILEGDYFEEFPDHILGTEVDGGRRGQEARAATPSSATSPASPRSRRGRSAESCAITNLPDLRGHAGHDRHARHGRRARRRRRRLRQAMDLGRRVDRYLALVAAEDPRALGLWPELPRRCEPQARARARGPRRQPVALARAARSAERRALAQRLLAAYQKTGELAPSVATPRTSSRSFAPSRATCSPRPSTSTARGAT
jgi:hypothetical protein